MTTMLSDHFSQEEATQSSTAIRSGIDNAPDDQQLANMKVQAAGMELVRTALDNHPIHIDSWLRVEALEKLLTRLDFLRWCKEHDHDETDPASWTTYFLLKAHPQGFGTDFFCPEFGTPDEIVEKIRASGIKVDQCIMEGVTPQGKGWVHVSFAPEMRGEFMVATFKDGAPEYTKLEEKTS